MTNNLRTTPICLRRMTNNLRTTPICLRRMPNNLRSALEPGLRRMTNNLRSETLGMRRMTNNLRSLAKSRRTWSAQNHSFCAFEKNLVAPCLRRIGNLRMSIEPALRRIANLRRTKSHILLGAVAPRCN